MDTAENMISLHRRRATLNVLLIIAFFYLMGGISAVAPKAVISTRPSANVEYLKRLDARTNTAADAREQRSESPTWDELSGRTEAYEVEQDTRIDDTGRSSKPE
jgi:hypothetical protein